MPQRGGGVGSRNKRVTLQRQVEVVDGSGGSTASWTPVSVLWADVTPGTGAEFWKQRELHPALSHVVSVRAGRTAILPTMRLIYGTRVLAIVAVVEVEEANRNRLLYCEEEVAT